MEARGVAQLRHIGIVVGDEDAVLCGAYFGNFPGFRDDRRLIRQFVPQLHRRRPPVDCRLRYLKRRTTVRVLRIDDHIEPTTQILRVSSAHVLAKAEIDALKHFHGGADPRIS